MDLETNNDKFNEGSSMHTSHLTHSSTGYLPVIFSGAFQPPGNTLGDCNNPPSINNEENGESLHELPKREATLTILTMEENYDEELSRHTGSRKLKTKTFQDINKVIGCKDFEYNKSRSFGTYLSFSSNEPKKVPVFTRNRVSIDKSGSQITRLNDRSCVFNETVNRNVAEKTTFCRPIVSYNQEYLSKIHERNNKLQCLVKKIIEVREQEKQKEAWNSYIRELRHKHRQYNYRDQLKHSYRKSKDAILNIQFIDDYFDNRFDPNLSGTFSCTSDNSSTSSSSIHITSKNHEMYENNSLCYPMSSQAQFKILQREKVRSRLRGSLQLNKDTHDHGVRNVIYVEKDLSKKRKRHKTKLRDAQTNTGLQTTMDEQTDYYKSVSTEFKAQPIDHSKITDYIQKGSKSELERRGSALQKVLTKDIKRKKVMNSSQKQNLEAVQSIAEDKKMEKSKSPTQLTLIPKLENSNKDENSQKQPKKETIDIQEKNMQLQNSFFDKNEIEKMKTINQEIPLVKETSVLQEKDTQTQPEKNMTEKNITQDTNKISNKTNMDENKNIASKINENGKLQSNIKEHNRPSKSLIDLLEKTNQEPNKSSINQNDEAKIKMNASHSKLALKAVHSIKDLIKSIVSKTSLKLSRSTLFHKDKEQTKFNEDKTKVPPQQTESTTMSQVTEHWHNTKTNSAVYERPSYTEKKKEVKGQEAQKEISEKQTEVDNKMQTEMNKNGTKKVSSLSEIYKEPSKIDPRAFKDTIQKEISNKETETLKEVSVLKTLDKVSESVAVLREQVEKSDNKDNFKTDTSDNKQKNTLETYGKISQSATKLKEQLEFTKITTRQNSLSSIEAKLDVLINSVNTLLAEVHQKMGAEKVEKCDMATCVSGNASLFIKVGNKIQDPSSNTTPGSQIITSDLAASGSSPVSKRQSYNECDMSACISKNRVQHPEFKAPEEFKTKFLCCRDVGTYFKVKKDTSSSYKTRSPTCDATASSFCDNHDCKILECHDLNADVSELKVNGPFTSTDDMDTKAKPSMDRKEEYSEIHQVPQTYSSMNAEAPRTFDFQNEEVLSKTGSKYTAIPYKSGSIYMENSRTSENRSAEVPRKSDSTNADVPQKIGSTYPKLPEKSKSKHEEVPLSDSKIINIPSKSVPTYSESLQKSGSINSKVPQKSGSINTNALKKSEFKNAELSLSLLEDVPLKQFSETRKNSQPDYVEEVVKPEYYVMEPLLRINEEVPLILEDKYKETQLPEPIVALSPKISEKDRKKQEKLDKKREKEMQKQEEKAKKEELKKRKKEEEDRKKSTKKNASTDTEKSTEQIKKIDTFICVPENAYLQYRSIDRGVSKIDDILNEELDKSNKAKRDIDNILKKEYQDPYGVQTDFDIPTRETATEVTASFSSSIATVEEISTFGKEMVIAAVNTDPLSLLELLRISTDTIRRLLASMNFDYCSYLTMLPLPQLHLQLPMSRNDISQYVCNICGAVFHRATDLSEHIHAHNLGSARDCCVCRHLLDLRQRCPGIFTCRYCGQCFTRAYCCELHQQSCARRLGRRHDVTESLMLLR